MAHILIVEDEPHIRFLIAKVLTDADHTVMEVGDGLEGLHALHTTPQAFDLIMLDLHMPKMDGFQFLDLVRRQPFYVPVMVVTAHRNLCAPIEDRGADACLSKPFNRKQVLELVDQLTAPQTNPFVSVPAANAYMGAFH
ncbi:MAG: response regulator [Anaerolineae bacterium]|nr:response regulator [Anaerolineae bacterium]